MWGICKGRRAERIPGEIAWTSRKQLQVCAVQVFATYTRGSWQSSLGAWGWVVVPHRNRKV